jgi:hypothetical protein
MGPRSIELPFTLLKPSASKSPGSAKRESGVGGFSFWAERNLDASPRFAPVDIAAKVRALSLLAIPKSTGGSFKGTALRTRQLDIVMF